MEFLRQFLILFDHRERLKLALLAAALILRAAAEMVGVASIMPFMAVLADPVAIEQNRYLLAVYEGLGFTSTRGFLTALGVSVVALLALANAFSAISLYAMLQFSWGIHHRLSVRLLKGYLAQPYTFFVRRNSATLHTRILSEVKEVVKGLITPLLNVMARALAVVALVVLLLVIDPVLALSVMVVLGGAYALLYLIFRNQQRRLGRQRVGANEARFKVAAEALGGIKDVKVLERERAFLEQFKPASLRYAKATASNAVMAQLPRYPLEAVALSGVVLIALYYLHVGDDLAQVLPAISLFALAGYRLMPELQQLFAAVTQIRFNRAALDHVAADLQLASNRSLPTGLPGPMAGGAVQLDQVSFRYPGASGPALEDVSLRIEPKTTVGLVGPSGSGKTTLVDLLLGLYPADQGSITVGGVELRGEALRSWRRSVGYIPQRIFLTDGSIAQNIAFGVPQAEIDFAAVERAARVAHLHDFVRSLPDGYATVVGERGVRLSGGQSQRVGIARALYHDPEVLIMDEATSALDGATESAVMDAIDGLAGKKTILLIAHRLSTVRQCDVIYMMRRGRLLAAGTFEQLATENDDFRRLAQLERPWQVPQTDALE